jgi:stage V sporulation protein G
MEITDIRLRKIDTGGKMKAVVSVTFDEEFVVHDIKVIESQNGYFIAMPSRKTSDGEFKDIAHPINSATRDRIQSAILAKFKASVSEEEQEQTAEPEPEKAVEQAPEVQKEKTAEEEKAVKESDE